MANFFLLLRTLALIVCLVAFIYTVIAILANKELEDFVAGPALLFVSIIAAVLFDFIAARRKAKQC